MNKSLYLFVIVLFPICSFAQYIAGSEIYYEKQGNRKYKLTAHVYRECDFPTLTGISGYVIADTVQRTINFTRVSISKFNDTCGNPCNVQNQASNPGIERHVFEAVVDFNIPNYSAFITQNKCMVSFAIRNGGRDGRATTHMGGNYYNEATVNICDSTIKNTSPRFSQDPKFFAQSNYTMYYSPGPLDTMDYDSLSFTLEPVLTNKNISVTYKNGHTSKIPFTPYCPPNAGTLNCNPLPNAKPARGFFFDSIYCQFVFTPTDNKEKGYTRIKISEYRKINGQMTLLGSVSREMLVDFTRLSWNTPPVFSPLPRIFNVCGSNMSSTFKTTDAPFLPMQTVADTTDIKYDKGYSEGRFSLDTTLRERIATVYLDPDTSSKPYPQYFTLTVSDKACNLNMSSYTYKVQNSRYFDYSKHYTIDSCNNITGYIKPNDSNLTLNGNIYLIEPDGNTKSILSPYRLNKNGTHYIRYQYSANFLCYNTKMDTIVVNNAIPNPKFNYTRDTVVCQSFPFNIRFNPSQLSQLQSWTWYKNDTVINKTDSFSSGNIFQNSRISLKAIIGQNCIAESSRNFSVKFVNIKPFQENETTVCANSEFQIAANIVGAKFPVTTHWRYGQNDTSVTGNLISLKTNNTDSLQLFIRLTDDNHCIALDTQLVMLHPKVKFDLQTNKPKYCADSIINIQIANYQGNPWRRSDWTVDFVPVGVSDVLSIDKSFSKTSVVRAYVKDSTNCPGYDSLVVEPINNPSVGLQNPEDICLGDSLSIKANLLNLASKYTLQWYLDGNIFNSNDSTFRYAPLNSGTFKLLAGNDSICYNSDMVNFTVHALPIVSIKPDSLFNRYALIQLVSVNDHLEYQWSTGDTTKTAEFWAYELGQPGKHEIRLKAIDINGCESEDTLYIYTDRFTDLKTNSAKGFRLYPNPVTSTLYVYCETLTPFKIIDINGKTVIKGEMNIGDNEIDMSKLDKGVYVIELNGWNKRIIKY